MKTNLRKMKNGSSDSANDKDVTIFGKQQTGMRIKTTFHYFLCFDCHAGVSASQLS